MVDKNNLLVNDIQTYPVRAHTPCHSPYTSSSPTSLDITSSTVPPSSEPIVEPIKNQNSQHDMSVVSAHPKPIARAKPSASLANSSSIGYVQSLSDSKTPSISFSSKRLSSNSTSIQNSVLHPKCNINKQGITQIIALQKMQPKSSDAFPLHNKGSIPKPSAINPFTIRLEDSKIPGKLNYQISDSFLAHIKELHTPLARPN